MGKKVLVSKWVKPLEIVERPNGIQVIGVKVYSGLSAHGRSQGSVKCPCCLVETSIYIWSFHGCGRRCSNCNILLGHSGAYAEFKELPKDFKIENYAV